MADSGRLDELKRKFDENPRRYFAPLANEYRKAGDTARAIELCRSYLPQQPGHMSGYIVYGQALFDAGRLDDAHEVLKQALSIDPENIIALRYLGDIARQAGDRATAMQWYGKVLELDPKNEEVASYVTGLAAPAPHAAAPAVRPEPEPSANAVALEDLMQEPDEPRAPTPMRPAWEQWAEPAQEPPPAASAEPDVSASPWAQEFTTPFETQRDRESESESGSGSESESESESESGSGYGAAEPHAPHGFIFEAQDETHRDDMHRDDTATAWPMDSTPAEPPTFEGVTWQDEDVSPAPPPESALDTAPDEAYVWTEPAAAEPTWPDSDWGTPAPAAESAGTEPSDAHESVPAEPALSESAPPEPMPPVSYIPEPDERTTAEPTAVDAESPFVTETMAELYWQQGFTAEALAVYRRLTTTRDDPRLVQRMREIEAVLASAPPPQLPEREIDSDVSGAPVIGEEPSSAAGARAESTPLGEPATVHAVSATVTVSPTVREFFARIGACKPAPTEFIPPAPARTDSLAALFERSALDERDERAAAALGGAFTRGP